jgi:hypothetical protein
MTADYFASLAVRAVAPERGIQPRRTTIFDAAAAAPGAAGPREPAAGAWTHGEYTLDDSVRPAQGSLGVGRAVRSEPTASIDDDGADGTRADAPRGQRPDEAIKEASRGGRPSSADAVVPATPLEPLTGRMATPTRRPDTSADRGRHVVDVVASVRRAAATNVAEAAGARPAGEREAVVRVHIGRVDVRAVIQPPAAPTAPRSSKPELMSLDEYVRQRRERRP